VLEMVWNRQRERGEEQAPQPCTAPIVTASIRCAARVYAPLADRPLHAVTKAERVFIRFGKPELDGHDAWASKTRS